MKIRNGFVSNSSSSSFICDVCGTVESGMDASPRDFDMEQCCNGHTFCNNHAEGLSKIKPNDLREIIKSKIASNKWSSVESKKEQYEELKNTDNEDLQDLYDNNYSDDGVSECQCPICSMVALRDYDGYMYLKKKFNLTDSNILNEIKSDFKNYMEFAKTIGTKK